MTDQPKWTPGHWTTKWSKYEEDTFIVQAGMPSNRVLAVFDGDGDGPDEQSLADAHLIAAAPDMADALADLMTAYAACNGEDHPAYMRAERALAKARGQA